MDPALYTGDQGAVEVMGFFERIGFEECKDRCIRGNGDADHFFGFPKCDPAGLVCSRKKAFPPRQCTGSFISHRRVQIKSVVQRISISSSIFTGSNPKRLLPIPISKKIASKTKFCLKWGGHRCYSWIFCRPIFPTVWRGWSTV